MPVPGGSGFWNNGTSHSYRERGSHDYGDRAEAGNRQTGGQTGTGRQQAAGDRVGRLFVCGTPIGNLEDITLRALAVLREVDVIAAEDTRHSRKLLSHFGISKPLVSYHEHNKSRNGPKILGMLSDGQDVALVSDAGMPSVSDPGAELVRQALDLGIRVIPVPGPSAVTTALSVSGIQAEEFTFVGFLPRKRAALKALLEEFSQSHRAMVAYEAPHRLLATLELMAEIMPGRPVFIAREITKVHEEFFRGTVKQAMEAFSGREVLGEITLILDGIKEADGARPTRPSWAAVPGALEHDIGEKVDRLLRQGTGVKEAVRIVTEATGCPRNEVYRIALAIRNEIQSGTGDKP